MPSPKIIACGHYHISTKAGNSFPAVLVRFPDEKNATRERYFWRSKRDFLLLSRAMSGPHSFPKKAFAKLSDQALTGGPWVCPDDDDAPSSGGYCEIVRRLSKQHTSNAANDDDDNNIESNFNPSMKKSLYRLDAFLSQAFDAAAKRNAKFITSSNSKDNNNADEDEKMIDKALATFCKTEHTEHLLVPSPRSDGNNNSTRNSSYTAHTSKAYRLGQYFASDDNAQLVISRMIELLEQDGERSNDDSYVFIEPSCGDGRIISKLLTATKQMKDGSINVLGYDIDANAIERAKTKLNGSKVLLECKDFLSLSRQDLLSRVQHFHSPNDELTLSRKRRRPDNGHEKIIVIGGPPYTPKELPKQFILHSITNLKADIVVFILPQRCEKEAAQIQQILNDRRTDGNLRWSYSNTELANIEFSFEKITVQQPSILQSWFKK